VVLGFNAEVLLEEASALESFGKFRDAAQVISSIIDQDRWCIPAILRQALFELAPTFGAEERGDVTEGAIDRASFLLRSAQRMRQEESEEGARAVVRRRGWFPIPPLWPIEALIAVRQGDTEKALAILEAEESAISEPIDRIAAATTRGLAAPSPTSEALLACMAEVVALLETPWLHRRSGSRHCGIGSGITRISTGCISSMPRRSPPRAS
jgi:hypothetical protein